MTKINKVTVLGSSGQIGAYLVSHLERAGYDVCSIDIVNDFSEDLRMSGNVLVEQSISSADFVFFLAFDVGGSPYLDKYQHKFNFIHNNNLIMSNTFGLLKRYKVPFVFASSQMSNMGHSPYGVLKHVGELYTKSLSGVVVKFWNVYGVEKDPEKTHVITDFIRKAMHGDSVHMRTDGTEEREFLYAEDCCEALVAIMSNYDEVKLEQELHVTSFQSSTILDVAKIVASLARHNVQFIPSELKDNVQKNARNIASESIKRWWRPKTSLERGIKKVWDAMNLDQQTKPRI